MRVALAAAALVMHAHAWSADMTPKDAFAAGIAFGLSPQGAEAVMNSISGTSAASKVPHYNTTNPNSVHYGSGAGDLMTPGVARVTECATAVYSDAKKQVECDAINDLAKNRAKRPPLIIAPSDPILARGKTVKADPASIAGAFGGAYTACSTIEVVKPATYEEEICNEYRSLGEEVCHKTLTVTVDISQSCTPGTWIDGGCVLGCYGKLQAYCDPTRSDGMIELRFVPANMHGICQIGYATVPAKPFTITAADEVKGGYKETCSSWTEDWSECWYEWTVDNAIALFINHWKGACTVAGAVGFVAGDHGCVGDTCTYRLRTYESGAGARIVGCTTKSGGWQSCQVTSGGPRWGHVARSDNVFIRPMLTVTETDSWINQCTHLEARAQ